MILPVILAGGSGERLWPLSRTAYPKQFLALLDAKHSLFQTTIQRLSTANLNLLPPLVVCHEEYRFIIAEQLRQIETKPAKIILEPKSNNTAPAIALAAQWAQTKYTNPILLIMPADHFIPDATQFAYSIQNAVDAAKQGYLVTFGITATKPETGYGYIQRGAELGNSNCFNVKKFIEKPDLARANKLIKNPENLWNSGMFLFSATNFLNELELLQPEISAASNQAMTNSQEDSDFIRPSAKSYANCPSISIDYAIMEHTTKAAVTPLNCTWSDIGNWQAVWEQSCRDKNNNYIHGDVTAINTTGCLIDARSRLVATLDVHDLAIVETTDAILIAKRGQAQDIKQIVAVLKQQSHPVASEHRQVMRPWGWYDSIAKGESFQVKRIVVEPGKSLSLQMHKFRSEHWVVVKGTAKVTRADETFMLTENESTFIPIGVKHQLKNTGQTPLELIEVQSGTYLGEDDIVRFNDDHGRATVDITTYVE